MQLILSHKLAVYLIVDVVTLAVFGIYHVAVAVCYRHKAAVGIIHGEAVAVGIGEINVVAVCIFDIYGIARGGELGRHAGFKDLLPSLGRLRDVRGVDLGKVFVILATAVTGHESHSRGIGIVHIDPVGGLVFTGGDAAELRAVILGLCQDVAELVVHRVEKPVVHVHRLRLMVGECALLIDVGVVGLKRVHVEKRDLHAALGSTEHDLSLTVELRRTKELEHTGTELLEEVGTRHLVVGTQPYMLDGNSEGLGVHGVGRNDII